MFFFDIVLRGGEEIRRGELNFVRSAPLSEFGAIARAGGVSTATLGSLRLGERPDAFGKTLGSLARRGVGAGEVGRRRGVGESVGIGEGVGIGASGERLLRASVGLGMESSGTSEASEGGEALRDGGEFRELRERLNRDIAEAEADGGGGGGLNEAQRSRAERLGREGRRTLEDESTLGKGAERLSRNEKSWRMHMQGMKTMGRLEPPHGRRVLKSLKWTKLLERDAARAEELGDKLERRGRLSGSEGRELGVLLRDGKGRASALQSRLASDFEEASPHEGDDVGRRVGRERLGAGYEALGLRAFRAQQKLADVEARTGAGGLPVGGREERVGLARREAREALGSARLMGDYVSGMDASAKGRVIGVMEARVSALEKDGGGSSSSLDLDEVMTMRRPGRRFPGTKWRAERRLRKQWRADASAGRELRVPASHKELTQRELLEGYMRYEASRSGGSLRTKTLETMRGRGEATHMMWEGGGPSREETWRQSQGGAGAWRSWRTPARGALGAAWSESEGMRQPEGAEARRGRAPNAAAMGLEDEKGALVFSGVRHGRLGRGALSAEQLGRLSDDALESRFQELVVDREASRMRTAVELREAFRGSATERESLTRLLEDQTTAAQAEDAAALATSGDSQLRSRIRGGSQEHLLLAPMLLVGEEEEMGSFSREYAAYSSFSSTPRQLSLPDGSGGSRKYRVDVSANPVILRRDARGGYMAEKTDVGLERMLGSATTPDIQGGALMRARELGARLGRFERRARLGRIGEREKAEMGRWGRYAGGLEKLALETKRQWRGEEMEGSFAGRVAALSSALGYKPILSGERGLEEVELVEASAKDATFRAMTETTG